MIRIITNFSEFAKHLTAPVNEGTFTVHYSLSDTMTVSEHLNLNQSKADITMTQDSGEEPDDMSRMIMLGQVLASEGSFVYVTNNESLLKMKKYGTDEACIYFVDNINEALKLAKKADGTSNSQPKTAPTKEQTPAREVSSTIEKAPEKDEQDTNSNKDYKTVETSDATQAESDGPAETNTKNVVSEEKSEDLKTEPAQIEKAPAAPAKEPGRRGRPKGSKNKVKEVKADTTKPAETKTESTPVQEDNKTAEEPKVVEFCTPQPIIDKLKLIDEEFGNYPDYIAAGIKESEDVNDLYFNLKFYIAPKLLDKTAKLLRPHFDELKQMVEDIKLSVEGVYYGDGEVLT